MCNEALNELAAPLPFAHCSQSRLVCSISGKPLNEYNQPMMMPNGYVYGEQVGHNLKLYINIYIPVSSYPHNKHILFYRLWKKWRRKIMVL